MADEMAELTASNADLSAEIARLRTFLEEHFPSETIWITKPCDSKDVLRVATRLLERLWRWEH